ncbi:MAG: hypothetical protein ACOC1X_01250 [Promethearchaeota archaeon]
MVDFRHNHKKWNKILKYKDKYNLSFAKDHEIIKNTENFSLISWDCGIFVFPNLEKFKLGVFKKEPYLESNIGINMEEPVKISLWGNFPKITHKLIDDLSYGVYLGQLSSIDLKNDNIKDKVLKKII